VPPAFGVDGDVSRAISLKNAPEPGTLNFAAESCNRFEAAGPAAALPYRLNRAQVSFERATSRFPAAARRRAGRLGTVAVPVGSVQRPDGWSALLGLWIGRDAASDEAGGVTGWTGLTICGG
jgi:hypothetical protein